MSTSIAPRPWAELVDVAIGWASFDHEHGEDPRPRLFGYAGDEAVAVVELRPFPPGGYERPVIEALSGLLGIGCDAVVSAMAGRVWSLDDPIVPVVGDLDMRQRVLAITAARRGERPRHWLVPFDRGTDITWEAPQQMNQPEGWVSSALDTSVQHDVDISFDDGVRQLARCTTLGHEVMLLGAGDDVGRAGT